MFVVYMLVMLALAIYAAVTAWWFGDSKTLLVIEGTIVFVVYIFLSIMVRLQFLIGVIEVTNLFHPGPL